MPSAYTTPADLVLCAWARHARSYLARSCPDPHVKGSCHSFTCANSNAAKTAAENLILVSYSFRGHVLDENVSAIQDIVAAALCKRLFVCSDWEDFMRTSENPDNNDLGQYH